MKKSLLLIPVTIALAIFFYPTTSISYTGGSPGGKTNSPSDGASCTECHYAGTGTGAIITTNIPTSGYTPNQVYTITANINQSGKNKFGFEITAEEANFGSTKTGSFLVTNGAEMKFVNNNTAITHKSGGTSGNGSRTWTMDWEAPNTGTGDVTFYGAFMAANGDGTNNGDTYHSTNLIVSEAIVNSVSNLSVQNNFRFNTVTKTIETINTVSVYDINGKLVLFTNEKLTNISHLNKGIYILKSENKTQKIIIK